MKFRKKPVVIDAFQWNGSNYLITDQMTIKGDSLFIETLEGIMEARLGDWIITGIAGEVYPCKPDIFEATYELIK